MVGQLGTLLGGLGKGLLSGTTSLDYLETFNSFILFNILHIIYYIKSCTTASKKMSSYEFAKHTDL